MGVSSIISPMCTAAVNISMKGVTDLWSEGLPELEKGTDVDKQMAFTAEISQESFLKKQTLKKVSVVSVFLIRNIYFLDHVYYLKSKKKHT